MIKGDFEPGFYIKHFIKDMGIALESAKEMGMSTPGLTLAKSLYDELANQGEENRGTQALYKLLDQHKEILEGLFQNPLHRVGGYAILAARGE